MLLSTALFSALPLLTLVSGSSHSNRSIHSRSSLTDSANILQNGVNALIATINADIQAAFAALGRGPSTTTVSGYIQLQYITGAQEDQNAYFYVAHQQPGYTFPTTLAQAAPFTIPSLDGTCKGISSGLLNIGSPLTPNFFYGAYNTDASATTLSQPDIDFSYKASTITQYSTNLFYETTIWSLTCPVAPAKTSAVLALRYGTTKYNICAVSSGINSQDSTKPPSRLFASYSCGYGPQKGIQVSMTFIATSPKF